MQRRIVLVTDSSKDLSSADLANIYLEGNSMSVNRAISEAISTFAQVVLYTELEEFRDNICKHINDLVFPMRYGPTSRTQKGLVVSLCESYGIPYLGADNYTLLLCNDKNLSKKYAREFGFMVPRSKIFWNLAPQQEIVFQISSLPLPLVVKPNFGGGSSGISDKSLVYDYNSAAELVALHLGKRPTPILVEEYIPGEEVSILLIGNQKKISFCGETQLIIEGEKYFNNRIWGYEEKKFDDTNVDYLVSHLTSQMDKERAIKIFQSFEKVEFMRIDGRVSEKGFYLLELSPDCYLGPDCDFVTAVKELGLNYSDFLKFIIENSPNHC